ncbi:hypothetical protein SAMN05421666_1856 [Roseovarius nanhaiticus]|uniref:DUF4157 domain-containing protein n=1 Tax=Roseovarius nanhaiticus TaxID=573024 RepID=A0A1N7GB14_9RHOB|nr:hypothetical protein SAMN05216208_0280 [Roseovarius nanhaiticus]SIS09765.1 hypothetical protein SAMN05421666_1856 [Roseovarius nanhaiticus]
MIRQGTGRAFWAVIAGLLTLTALAACSRPLTPNERAFAADIIGPALDVDRVRIARGFTTIPEAPQTPDISDLYPIVDENTVTGLCTRSAPEPRSGPPPGWALWNRVHFNREFYRADLAPGWPKAARFPQGLVLAHELVHVWQWQNRRITGYRPTRAALESVLNMDPYFYVPDEGATLLDFGYEQQAALLEDYLCHALYDPAAPRRAELRPLLAPYFPLDRLDAALGR